MSPPLFDQFLTQFNSPKILKLRFRHMTVYISVLLALHLKYKALVITQSFIFIGDKRNYD